MIISPKQIAVRVVPAIWLALMLTASTALAIKFPDKPADMDWYVDMAGMMDQASVKSVNDMAIELWAKDSIPVYVVTIPSLAAMEAANYSIESYATELFNHWGIGTQDRNYGMLLLVSKGDRKARIELGAGFAHDHDPAMKNVMDTLIVPAFKRGDFKVGIVDGVRGMTAVVRGLALPAPTLPWWWWPAVIAGILGIIALIINLFQTGRSGWAWALIVALAGLIFYLLWASSKAGGSGGGFGGGSSGGGGATGSW